MNIGELILFAILFFFIFGMSIVMTGVISDIFNIKLIEKDNDSINLITITIITIISFSFVYFTVFN